MGFHVFLKYLGHLHLIKKHCKTAQIKWLTYLQMLCYIYWQRKWANGPNPQGHSHCFLRLILACSFYFCLLFSFSKEKEHKEGKCFSCKHLKSISNDANILGSSKAIWTVIIEANGLWTPNNWVRVKGFHQPTSYVLEKWGGVTDFEAIPITRAFLQGSS